MRHLPRYIFRENEEVQAYQVWLSDVESGIIHPQCAGTSAEREFPLYADDLDAVRCAEPIYCEGCNEVMVEALN